MPKRKKYPRLPNSFGSIRYLGSGRSNPYAVHPPASYNEETNRFDRPKALCYVDDWYVGFAVLNAYRAGRYQPGDEILFIHISYTYKMRLFMLFFNYICAYFVSIKKIRRYF